MSSAAGNQAVARLARDASLPGRPAGSAGVLMAALTGSLSAAGNQAVAGLLHGRAEAGTAAVAGGQVRVSAPDSTAERQAAQIARGTAVAGGPQILPAAPGAGRSLVPGSDGLSMDPALRGRLERTLSAGLSEVRIHDDAASHALANAVGAQAATRGSRIYFGEGRFAPHTAAGQELLRHELAHTLQPEAGSVLHRVPEDGGVVAGSSSDAGPPQPVWEVTIGDAEVEPPQDAGPELPAAQVAAGPGGSGGAPQLQVSQSEEAVTVSVSGLPVLTITGKDVTAQDGYDQATHRYRMVVGLPAGSAYTWNEPNVAALAQRNPGVAGALAVVVSSAAEQPITVPDTRRFGSAAPKTRTATPASGPHAAPAELQPGAPDPVAGMDELDRLKDAVLATGRHLPGAVGDQLAELVSPEALVMLGTFAAAQAVGLGELVDAVGFVLLALKIGGDAPVVAEDLYDFFRLTFNAHSRKDLDEAGQHLAHAIILAGVDTLMALIATKGSQPKGASTEPVGTRSPTLAEVTEGGLPANDAVAPPADNVVPLRKPVAKIRAGTGTDGPIVVEPGEVPGGAGRPTAMADRTGEPPGGSGTRTRGSGGGSGEIPGRSLAGRPASQPALRQRQRGGPRAANDNEIPTDGTPVKSSPAQRVGDLESRIEALGNEAMMDSLNSIDNPSTPEGAAQLDALERAVGRAEESPAGQSARGTEPGLSDRATPGGPQPKQLEQGIFAHDYAEPLGDVASPKPADIPAKFNAQVTSGKIIPLKEMPPGLSVEPKLGVTARPDRAGGTSIIYEIKPNTETSIEAGLARVEEYVRLANATNFLGRTNWTGKVVVYDFAVVKNLVP